MKKLRVLVAEVLANDNSNLHSLSVQMRRALEFAGQVVMVFHNLLTAMRPHVDAIYRYLNADFTLVPKTNYRSRICGRAPVSIGAGSDSCNNFKGFAALRRGAF